MVKDGIFLSERYEVLSKIGAGGMADVYKGRDVMLNRYVAIKVLKKEYREDENFVKKFRSEAQAAAGLMNPNIVNVYDVGEDRGLYYMVMELVEGITLKEYIQKKGKLSTKEVISISIQMCTGIEAAHKHNIIHRDIKPQNIIISKDGKVKVTDFGIAKATTSHTVSTSAMGSVHYVSPEQARGGFCDAKSDIYSVGITMYEMVTGQVPFDGDSTVSVAMKHLQEVMTPPSELAPSVSPALERIIMKCTQKSPERRYPNVADLIQDLKRALVDPDGDFVETVPIRSIGDTVMISQDEMGRLKRGYGRKAYDEDGADDSDEDSYDDDSYDDDSYDDGYDDDGYDRDGYDDDYEDDSYDGEGRRGDRRDRKRGGSNEVNQGMNKIMKIMTIVVIAIIVFVLIFLIGKAVGAFKIGPGKEETQQKEELVDVPKLVGEEEAIAEQICKKRGLVMKVTKAHSDEYKEGLVFEQKTAAGEKVKKKTVIEVMVSSGAEEKEVPDVSGKDEADAVKELNEAGFKNITPDLKYDDEIEEGKVIETSPGEGETVTVDTEIVLWVSKGAEKKEVPKLEGLTRSAAEKALKDAGLGIGSVDEEYHDTVAEGKVISQSVNEGKKVEAGTTVSIVISKGRKPKDKVPVPSLNNKTLVDAKKALSNVGLQYDPVEVDSPYESGRVVDCDPGEGTEVEVGTTITIYVSNGSGHTDPGNGGTDNSGEGGSTGEQ